MRWTTDGGTGANLDFSISQMSEQGQGQGQGQGWRRLWSWSLCSWAIGWRSPSLGRVGRIPVELCQQRPRAEPLDLRGRPLRPSKLMAQATGLVRGRGPSDSVGLVGHQWPHTPHPAAENRGRGGWGCHGSPSGPCSSPSGPRLPRAPAPIPVLGLDKGASVLPAPPSQSD